MKHILFTAALAFSFGAVSTVTAADYRYEHNGSQMRVTTSGDNVRIYYEKPRKGLSGIGVQVGTLLFEGRQNGGYLEGMSRIFNANCGEVDYFVHGDFTPGQSFKLSGAAPVLSNMSCRIVDNIYTGSNANLVFTTLGGQQAQAPQPSPTTAGCVKGVQSGSWLNVRVGPNSDYGKIGEIAGGSCGIEISANCSGQWCLVQQGNTYGWAHMTYIQR